MATSKQKRDDDNKEEAEPERPSDEAASGLENSGYQPSAEAFPLNDLQPPVLLMDLHGHLPMPSSSADGQAGFSPTSSTPLAPLHHQNAAPSSMSMGSFADPMPDCFLHSTAPYLGAEGLGAPHRGAVASVQPSCSSGGSDDTQNGGVSSTSCDLPGESRGKKKGSVVKDEAYWEKRRKNNESAKRSRENRRNKEHLISARHTVLSSQFCTLEGVMNAVLQQIADLERTYLGRTVETSSLLENIFEWNDSLLHELQGLLKETALNLRRESDADLQYDPYLPHNNHFQGPPPPPPPPPPPSAGGIVG